MRRIGTLIALLGLALTGCQTTTRPQDLSQMLEGGSRKIRLAPGEYRLDEGLLLEDLHGVEIDAHGARLIMTKWVTALTVNGCSDLTIRGLTIDYDPLPFTQGTITAVDHDSGELRVAIHDGYPDLTPELAVTRCHVFDGQDLSWKVGVPDLYGRTTIQDARHGLFHTRQSLDGVAVGDQAVFNLRGGAAIRVGRQSERLTFEDVTLQASPGLGVIGRFTLGDDTYRRLRIVPGPPPAGATQPRLFSACADGLNYAYTRRGPLVEDCDFSRLGDDAINLHTTTLPVFEKLDDRSFLTFRPYGNEGFPQVSRAGDPVRLMAARTFAVTGETTLASLEPHASRPISPEERERWYPTAKASGKQRATFYKVTLAEPIPFAAGDFLDLPAMGCGGFVIRRNYFHDHRARGIRCMASDGVIHGNRLERLKQAGITLGPEYAYWREAGWVDHVVVTDNVLTAVWQGGRAHSAATYTAGAISVFGHVAAQPDGSTYPGNHTITLRGNTIVASPEPAIAVSAARDVTQAENRVLPAD